MVQIERGSSQSSVQQKIAKHELGSKKIENARA
jgi:hypothetical protein